MIAYLKNIFSNINRKHIIPSFNYLIIFVVSLISVYYYLYDIEFLPLGYYYDNLSIVSNAICLNKLGVDEYGEKYPLIFLSLGDYKLPIVPYLLSIIHYFIPLNLLVSRIVTLILGLTGLMVISFIFKDKFKNYIFVISIVFVFSNILISSSFWSIQRSGFEVGYTIAYNSVLFFFCLNGLKNKNILYAVIGSLMILLSIFLYQSYKVIFIPLLIFYIFLNYLRKTISLSTFIFSLFSSIILISIFILFNKETFFGRFHQISSENPQSLNPFDLVNLYFKHFNLKFLFFQGDISFRHSIGKIGTYSLGLMIPFILGFYRNLRYLLIHRNNFSSKFTIKIFILFFFLISFIPASIINEGVLHALRSYNILISFIIYCIDGFYFLFLYCNKIKKIKEYKSVIAHVLLIIVLLLSLYNLNSFVRRIYAYPIPSYFSQAYWTILQQNKIMELTINKNTYEKNLMHLHRKLSKEDLPTYQKYEEILENKNYNHCSKIYQINGK